MRFPRRQRISGTESPARAEKTPRRAFCPSSIGESLEERQLLSASLGPIANLDVPALQGYTLPLDGSGTTDVQTFSAVSSNPDIAVSVVSTTFWNVGVSYTDPTNSADDFTGTLTFALFGNLTPNTVKMITEFTNDDYYVESGKFIWRVVTDFGGTSNSVIQGGSTTAPGSTAPSGQPGTPFPNENLQQLALTGSDQLALANSGGSDSNDAQFFINTGPLDQTLGYNYTVFGQLVSGAATIARMTQVPVQANGLGEVSNPVNPITITSTSLSTASDSGVVLIDTTQAHAGETATITVTANDSVDTTKAKQSFVVTVGPYAGPTDASQLATVNFKPYTTAVTTTTTFGTAVAIQLAGQGTFPTLPVSVSSYAIVSAPAHGTISDFNPSTGALRYTPTPGFVGTDSFTYTATENGPNSGQPAATSNPTTVTITVNAGVVTLHEVDTLTNSKHRIMQLELVWSGPLDATLAGSKAPFHLSMANRKGSFTGRGSSTIAIKKVAYDDNTWTVTLTPRTLLPRSKQVELLVHGNGKNGLKDAFGQFIAGTGGQSGTDAIAIV
jgi:cyclophilin family peptidyl-prolyl cis-trans isomerase